MIPYFSLNSFSLGPVTIQVWGLFVSLGFLSALSVSLQEARREKIKEVYVWDVMILILIGMIIGSKIFFIIFSDINKENFFQFFSGAGFSLMPGVLFSVLLVAGYFYVKKIDAFKIADIFTIGFVSAIIIVRIGCFLVYDHIGSTTNLFWAREYIDGTARHPVSIYHIISALVILCIICYFKGRQLKKGALFLLFALLYSIFRFFVDFFRCYDLIVCENRFEGLTYTQWILIVVLIFVTYFLLKENVDFSKFNSIIKKKMDSSSELEKMEENKNNEGGKNENEKIFLLEEKKEFFDSDFFKKIKKIINSVDKNVFLIIFGLILGIVISGSFGIDFFKGKRGRVLGENTSIFEENGKTWVAYDEPMVNATVISDKNCEACNYDEIVKMMKGSVVPTINVKEIDFDSEEAEDLINSFDIKFIPAFVFDSNITKIESYNEAKEVFVEKDGEYFLDSSKVGLPVGRYLESIKVQEDDILIGPKEAPVTIVEFSDFQCPYCKKAKDVVDEILKEYDGKIKLVFKHFPLQFHDNAKKAAEAAECANEQGKFRQMHDAMFNDQEKLSVSDLKYTAAKIGLNTTQFNGCLDSGKYNEKVEDDMKIGEEFGVSGTPAFFINNQYLSGARSLEEFQKIIDSELNR